MNIYLLRHGRTTEPGRYIGVTDVAMSTEGVEQIDRLADYLGGITFDRCFCSPQRRCQQTLHRLNIACPCSEVPEIREIDFGRWEGLSFAEVAAQDKELVERWGLEQEHFTFPGGDTVTDFIERICSWFDRLLSSDARQVLVITHSGVIRHGLCHLLGIEQRQAFCFAIEEAGLALIGYEHDFSCLKLLNGGGLCG